MMLTGSQERRMSAAVPAAAAGEQWRAHYTSLVMDRQYRLAVRARIFAPNSHVVAVIVIYHPISNHTSPWLELTTFAPPAGVTVVSSCVVIPKINLP
ncbi:hypothetical protein TcasGA2_TC003577 [Tribolium castaneum]|uniref:Uncharacterized protein n=1 Tax=Tribolium castaneum TaxID=7070 RepID=D6WHV1_TRICA|nr:hypothetical protein TcasGA2_TC003577 [Tribolium castaneum]